MLSAMKYSSQIISDFIQCILRCESAKTADQFSNAYRQAVELIEQILNRDYEAGWTSPFHFLFVAFAELKSRKRAHLILQHMSWILFERTPLDREPDSNIGFHLFALPFIVQFNEAPCNNNVILEGPELNGRSVIEALKTSGVLAQDEEARGFTALLTPYDLSLFGPMNISSAFRRAELGGEVMLLPFPWTEENEPDMRRVSLVFLPMATFGPLASSCPAIDRVHRHQAQELEQLLRKSLEDMKLEPELVVSLPPQKVSNMLASTSPAAVAETTAIFQQAKKQLGVVSAGARFPTPGYFELFGQDGDGELFVLSPPKVHFEPAAVVLDILKTCANTAELAWAGKKVSLSTTSYLH